MEKRLSFEAAFDCETVPGSIQRHKPGRQAPQGMDAQTMLDYMGIVMDTEKLQDRSFTINLADGC